MIIKGFLIIGVILSSPLSVDVTFETVIFDIWQIETTFTNSKSETAHALTTQWNCGELEIGSDATTVSKIKTI